MNNNLSYYAKNLINTYLLIAVCILPQLAFSNNPGRQDRLQI